MLKNNFLEIEMFPLLWGVGILALVAIVLVVILIINKKPKSKIKVDDEFINNIIEYYGGKDNIGAISVDNARLKVEVKDLDIVNLEQLKANSEAGVFITGNIIKTLFKFDSKLIKSSIEKKL